MAKVFGAPSLPRCAQPSMFQLLSWQEKDQDCLKRPSSAPKETLFSQQKVVLKKTPTETGPLLVHRQSQVQESQQEDMTREELQKRKLRIKQFQYVKRDLPNTSYLTYYGKPAFEAYGRGGAGTLRTHNIMPHAGQNRPLRLQTYYNALVKSKKQGASRHSQKDTLHKNPQKVLIHDENGGIHIDLQAPDLLHHIRFAERNEHLSKNQPIPKCAVRPAKSGVKKKQKRAKTVLNKEDGLSYMNTRTQLLSILQQKKTNATKLAYKVTQCIPKQNRAESLMEKPAGKANLKQGFKMKQSPI